MNHIAIVRRCESIVVTNRAVEIKTTKPVLAALSKDETGMQSSWELAWRILSWREPQALPPGTPKERRISLDSGGSAAVGWALMRDAG
jgi:hypothetical protein